jgi:hypothetical protein
MTVAELIAELSQFPSELTVMADDYENGRYEIRRVETSDLYGSMPAHVVILG